MKISEILDKRAIKIGVGATTKEDALKELVDVVVTPFVEAVVAVMPKPLGLVTTLPDL